MRKFWLPLAVILMTALPLLADTVVLKTGETLEGKVTGETDKDVTIEVKVSDGVTDERTISKGDISTMQKTTPEEAAFQAIKNLQPAQEAFSQTAFDGDIGALQNFLDTYPTSLHGDEVKQELKVFQDERTHLEHGQYKVFGHWISKEEAMKERYEIAAKELYASMQGLVQNRDFIGALNTFTEIEKTYPGARVYPDSVDLARQVLAALHPDIDRRLEVWQHDEDERVKGLDLVAEPEKSQLVAAAKAEADRYNLLCLNATKAGLKWIPLFPRSQKSLLILQGTVATEEQRLAGLPVEQMHESIQALDRASEDIEQEDALGADAELKEAQSLWPANHALADAGLRLSRLKADLKATPYPTPPKAATPAVKPTPHAPAPATAGAPAPAAGAAVGVAQAAAAKPPSLPPPPPPPPENAILSFFMSPSGMLLGVGVVVLGAGGAVLATRARKQKEAAAE